MNFKKYLESLSMDKNIPERYRKYYFQCLLDIIGVKEETINNIQKEIVAICKKHEAKNVEIIKDAWTQKEFGVKMLLPNSKIAKLLDELRKLNENLYIDVYDSEKNIRLDEL